MENKKLIDCYYYLEDQKNLIRHKTFRVSKFQLSDELKKSKEPINLITCVIKMKDGSESILNKHELHILFEEYLTKIKGKKAIINSLIVLP